MEFHEKLQEPRKQKGLTQEDLAASLYVSRTAISKWESGRGYPNIDSLKAIAKFYSVTIDKLLSGVHWFTDIIGGALLSAGLVLLYDSICSHFSAVR